MLTAGTLEASGTVARLGGVGCAAAAVKAEAGAAFSCGGRPQAYEDKTQAGKLMAASSWQVAVVFCLVIPEIRDTVDK